MDADTIWLYMTAGSPQEGLRIARALVEERLVACANLLPGVTSIYRWEGRIHEDPEVALVAKTTSARVAAVTDRVRALHSYDCPCVVALPILGGNPEFLDWIRTETS